MLSSSMLLLNLILLIDVTFSTPTGVGVEKVSDGRTRRRIPAIQYSVPLQLSGGFRPQTPQNTKQISCQNCSDRSLRQSQGHTLNPPIKVKRPTFLSQR